MISDPDHRREAEPSDVPHGPTGPYAMLDPDGAVRIGWAAKEPPGPGITGHDWFGPGRAHGPDGVECTVRSEVDHLVFRIEALEHLDGLATGRIEDPAVGWPVFTPAERLPDGIDPDARALAFLGCEFALPTRARADLDGWATLPGRPATAWPLLVRAPDGRTVLLAPLASFHDQTIGINDGTLRCGWHGDLDSVPAGFSTELVVLGGDGPRDCLDRWGQMLLEHAGTRRPGRYADALATRPSYWTDNGAAYWYRTEPGHDAAGSIVAAVSDLRERGVPIGAVQLDSWFYPHATLRPFDTDDWEVPPTAMLAWEERTDVLPGGIADLRHRLGHPPLVAHIRHLAAAAPIAAEVPVAVDRDGEHAVPTSAAAYERWLDQCVTWGVETFEHDWLVDVFHRNRWLRERPGRAAAWQEGIDGAARERGITLQWCMATPADFAQTVSLSQVTSIRTSGDHGYIATPGQLWAWFCTTNALARALGLTPFKDVFRADPELAGALGEPEALLSALSSGPVGLGDRVGRFDPALALRCCRADGVLVKPHVPIAATDESMVSAAPRADGSPATGPRPLVAECWSDHPAGRWTYLMALHCRPGREPVSGRVALAELGRATPSGESIAWNWRTGTAERVTADHEWSVELEREGWWYSVLAPVLAGGLAVIGDVSKFVPAGDSRLDIAIGTDGAVRVVVKGAGETVTITGWAERSSPTSAGHDVSWDPTTRVWSIEVPVPARGWTSVEIRPGH
ncbi:hypothetical protein BH23ACT3_BH23ACT3_04150 [soil metagenome]